MQAKRTIWALFRLPSRLKCVFICAHLQRGSRAATCCQKLTTNSISVCKNKTIFLFPREQYKPWSPINPGLDHRALLFGSGSGRAPPPAGTSQAAGQVLLRGFFKPESLLLLAFLDVLLQQQ